MILKHISKIYHNRNNQVEALKDINLSFEYLGITSIVGPSGCGKTTLLNIMAGNDHDYQGTIIGNNNVELIEQESMLFESMSVIDNLLVVGAMQECVLLLEQFGLLALKHHKVKHLSGGEKKRIQIIRSLLMKPSILLCDEPTVSLDHDNKIVVMEMLKKVSTMCCVIMVTHENDIADAYSDRIIEIDAGCIINDTQIHQTEEWNETNVVKRKKKSMDHIAFLYRYMKSRKTFHITCALLVFCMVFGLFMSMNMVSTVEKEIDKNMMAYYNKNIITTTPHQEFDHSDPYFRKYDTLTYKQIKDIVKQVPDIQAYTFGMNYSIYSNREYSIDDEDGIAYRIGDTYEPMLTRPYTPFNHLLVDEDGNDIKSDCIYWSPEIPYITFKDNIFKEEYRYPIELEDGEESHIDEWPTDTREDTGYSIPALVYQIVEGKEIPLLYGKQCTKQDEMVVDHQVAKELCKKYGIKNTEALIGKRFSVYWFVNFAEKSPSKSFVITGIANLESVYEHQAFVPENAWMNTLESVFNIEEEKWYFPEVDFMIDPSLDVSKALDHINDVYHGEDSDFGFKDYDWITMYNLRASYGHFAEVKPVIKTASFQKTTMVVSGVVFILYLAMEGIFIKRRRKENYLLQKYSYSPYFIGIAKTLSYILLTGMIMIGLGMFICEEVNALLMNIYSDYDIQSIIMEYDILKISICLLVSALILLVEDVIMNVYTIKKHQ